ncbi:MAG: glutamine amidotransferase [Candidatus Methanomethyliaceae archaeon]
MNSVNSKLKILLIGESWVTQSTHIKGFDSFVTSHYYEGARELIQQLQGGGVEVEYIANHMVAERFPKSLDQLRRYHAVILSDVGSNTLLLDPQVFLRSTVTQNRLELLVDYVRKGGALCMVGGYMSFSGIDGKARYGETPLAEVLPVQLKNGDDRKETPEGVSPTILLPSHQIFQGLPGEWPRFLGYNVLRRREGFDVLAVVEEDVFIGVGEFGAGRTLAFASDCGPHWGAEFEKWPYYGKFWLNVVRYLAGR